MVQSVSVSGFPLEKVSAILAGWWNNKTRSPLKAPPMKVSGTVFAIQPELSSQQAVGVLVACKDVLGYRPSKDVIKKGGYRNLADFVNTILSAMQKEFVSKHVPSPAHIVSQGVSANATISL